MAAILAVESIDWVLICLSESVSP